MVRRSSTGITLIELIVVMAIVVTLIALSTIHFSSMAKKYEIERQINVIHANLSKARSESIFKTRTHFVVIERQGMSIVADTYPAPFGDGHMSADDQVILSSINFKMPITGDGLISFDSRGYVPISQSRTVCIYSDCKPAQDCIVISRTRINSGRIKDQLKPCIPTNCSQL